MAADIDITELAYLGGTAAGGYYGLDDRVVLAWAHEGYCQTLDGSRASLDELHRIARERGRAQVLVVDVDRVGSQDAASRRLWRREPDPSLVAGVVLLRSSMLARAIVSFVLGLTRPAIPIATAGTLEEAIAEARGLIGSGARSSDE